MCIPFFSPEYMYCENEIFRLIFFNSLDNFEQKKFGTTSALNFEPNRTIELDQPDMLLSDNCCCQPDIQISHHEKPKNNPDKMCFCYCS